MGGISSYEKLYRGLLIRWCELMEKERPHLYYLHPSNNFNPATFLKLLGLG